jgi:hypothetical protein
MITIIVEGNVVADVVSDDPALIGRTRAIHRPSDGQSPESCRRWHCGTSIPLSVRRNQWWPAAAHDHR